MTSGAPPTYVVAAVYWRKNPFLAAMMKPLVLTLADGRFTAIGPDGEVVFDAPANTVRGKLGKMGSLKIAVNGRKYAIVGRGSLGGSEQGHTDLQRKYVVGFAQQHPQFATMDGVHVGPIDAVLNQSAAAKLGVWRDALVAAGAAVR